MVTVTQEFTEYRKDLTHKTRIDKHSFAGLMTTQTQSKIFILQTSFHQISNIPKLTVTYCNSRHILVKLDNTHTYQQVTQAYAQVTAIQIETYECHD